MPQGILQGVQCSHWHLCDSAGFWGGEVCLKLLNVLVLSPAKVALQLFLASPQ